MIIKINTGMYLNSDQIETINIISNYDLNMPEKFFKVIIRLKTIDEIYKDNEDIEDDKTFEKYVFLNNTVVSQNFETHRDAENWINSTLPVYFRNTDKNPDELH